MEENGIISIEEQADDTWKFKTLIIGAVVGMLTGIGAAYLLTKRAEQNGTQLAISPGKGVQLGVMLAGLMRSILSLGED
jgi:DMSO reductase anchor subunit